MHSIKSLEIKAKTIVQKNKIIHTQKKFFHINAKQTDQEKLFINKYSLTKPNIPIIDVETALRCCHGVGL